jgi:hypothetical protein
LLLQEINNLEQLLKRIKWTRPQLVVIIRYKPEEGVLGNCKIVSIAGPATGFDACNLVVDECLELVGS